MQGEFSAGKVIVTPETEQEAENWAIKGYGRRKSARTELSQEEVAFLLERGKLTLKLEDSELSFEEFLIRVLDTTPMFTVRYLVYKDLKERGYAIKTGGVDFWLYPRGAKPGEKPAKYFIHIRAEREFISLIELNELLISARNMRKELILAVVDEESDITYYEVKDPRFDGGIEVESTEGKAKASLVGDRVVLWDADLAENLYKNNFYGKLTKEKRLLLSLVEAAYLMKTNRLDIETPSSNHANMSFEQFIVYASTIETDFMDKYLVYEDLKGKGLNAKTGFKFGSHFRVYKAEQQKHSLYLVHVLPHSHVFSMTGLSRAVRLAHGVKKRMIFAFMSSSSTVQAPPTEQTPEQRIKYVDVGRMKL